MLALTLQLYHTRQLLGTHMQIHQHTIKHANAKHCKVTSNEEKKNLTQPSFEYIAKDAKLNVQLHYAIGKPCQGKNVLEKK